MRHSPGPLPRYSLCALFVSLAWLAVAARPAAWVVAGAVAVTAGAVAVTAGATLAAAGCAAVRLAALDAAGWALEAWAGARRASTLLLTVWCDPFGQAGRLIALRPPVTVALAGEPARQVVAVRVARPRRAGAAPGGRALRAVEWLYREFPEADRGDWAFCAWAAGLAAPPRHVLGLHGAGG